MSPDYTIDSIDRRIICALQRDGRLSNLELADRVGLSPSPCLRRVRRLEAQRIIEGYGARLNAQRIGLGVTAFVAVTLQRHSERQATEFREAVQSAAEVVSCHITSGEHDFLLQVMVTDLHAYREFTLKRLLNFPGVKDIRSSFVIDAIKENGLLPLDHLG